MLLPPLCVRWHNTLPPQVDRYIKKATKDPRVRNAVAQLAAIVEAAVRQNNTVDVFEVRWPCPPYYLAAHPRMSRYLPTYPPTHPPTHPY